MIKKIARKMINTLKKIKQIVVCYLQYRKIQGDSLRRGFSLNWRDRYIIYNDDTASTEFDAHYVYHVAWAMRKIMVIKPPKHVDFSSSLNFCANLSSLVPVEFYDYRPANLQLSNLICKKADLTDLSNIESNSLDSISCMHVVEHIGLGRYGDALAADGDLKAIRELKRVVKDGGAILFVVPVGKPQIQFNAHRIYSYEQIVECFSDFELQEFSLIPDNAIDIGMIYNADKELVKQQKYACGCFYFVKRKKN